MLQKICFFFFFISIFNCFEIKHGHPILIENLKDNDNSCKTNGISCFQNCADEGYEEDQCVNKCCRCEIGCREKCLIRTNFYDSEKCINICCTAWKSKIFYNK